MWYFILLYEPVKNADPFYSSKSGDLLSLHSEQQFKIQSHSIIFDPVNVEGQWYGGRASQALKSICELFGNI